MVVGVSATLHLKYAEAFIRELYTGIVRGDSLAAALQQAKIVAHAAYPIPDAIQIQTADGADAGTMILLAPAP